MAMQSRKDQTSFKSDMGRQLLFGVGSFFKRMDFYALLGTFVAMLAVILPLIPETNLYSFFSFKNVFELIFYVVGLTFTFVILSVGFYVIGMLLTSWGRSVKIDVAFNEYIQDNHEPQHISLIIRNNQIDDLTDCRATLLVAEQLNFDRYNPSRDILQIVNPNDSLMSWGGGSQTEYVTIPGEGGRKVLNIACHKGNGRVSFLFHDWESEPQWEGIEYHVIVKLDGRLNGNPFRTITYDGCFKTEFAENATRCGYEFRRISIKGTKRNDWQET